MPTDTEIKSYVRTRPGYTYIGPDARFYATAEIVEELEAKVIAERVDDFGQPGIGQQSQYDIDGSPSRVDTDDADPPADDPAESAEILPASHYRDLTSWQRAVLAARYADLDAETQREYDLQKTEFDMETPVGEGDSPEDPTAVIGRPQTSRGSTGVEPQTSFNEESIDIENGEAEWYKILNAREDNKVAHATYVAADSDVKKGLIRMGYYDGKPHTIRAGEFVISIVKSDAAAKDISFTREPSIFKKIKKG